MEKMTMVLTSTMIGCAIGGWYMVHTTPVIDDSHYLHFPDFMSPAEIDRLLNANSSHAGFQKKQGMVPPEFFLKTSLASRKESFNEWVDQYVFHPGFSHPPTPFPYCQVYINHIYKFIWIKGHKVASTSMRKPLGWLCEDHWRVPKGANFTYCSQPLFNDPNAKAEQIEKWWKEYFVFAVVRNPFTRFSSAHEYISPMLPSKCDSPVFSETCKDIYLQSKTCWRQHCCPNSTAIHHIRHIADQSSCMLTRDLSFAVDFIGEMENLDTDLQVILDTINNRKDPSLPLLPVSSTPHANMHNSRESNYIRNLFLGSKECVLTLLNQYKKDFALLGYLEGVL